MAYVGNTPSRGQWRKLTDISASFDGVTTTFTTSVPPGTSEYYVTAGTASQLIISIGGVIQEPDVDYSVSTYSITFTTAPAAGLSFFGILCGDALNTGVPSDGSITTAKLGGNLTVDLAAGTAAAPSLTFDSNTGLYSPAPDEVSISTNGTERLRIDSAGQIEAVSLGTASAPTFSFTGDVNTGIYSPGADQLAVSTGGTGRLFIDSSGRVGIGTSSPSTKTHLYDASNVALKIESGGANYVETNFINTSAAYTLGIRPDTSNSLCIRDNTASATRFVLDSSGRLGIGTTSAGGILHTLTTGSDNVNFFERASGAKFGIYNSSVNSYIGTFSNHDLRLATNDTERARIDTSGRLLVGTSSHTASTRASFTGHSSSGTGEGIAFFQRGSAASSGNRLGDLRFSDNSDISFAGIAAEADGTVTGGSKPGRLLFSVTRDGSASPTSAMRITNSGRTVVLGYTNAFDAYSEQGAGTSFELFIGGHSATTTAPGSGTNSFRVFTNGNVQNTNNSYGSLSDAKLKENIVDAGSQWNDLKSLQVRKYNFKEETGQQTHTQIGLVAQEVELVSPGLVTESPDRDAEGNDLGTVTKSVNYSVLYMKAVKALQEAMERIETLEAKVAALESA